MVVVGVVVLYCGGGNVLKVNLSFCLCALTLTRLAYPPYIPKVSQFVYRANKTGLFYCVTGTDL